MLRPEPGSSLHWEELFAWTEGHDVSRYRLMIGSSLGGGDIYDRTTERTEAFVDGLPHDGRKIYVRLQSFTRGEWLYNDYTYTADTHREWFDGR
jgi:hypothetical protein